MDIVLSHFMTDKVMVPEEEPPCDPPRRIRRPSQPQTDSFLLNLPEDIRYLIYDQLTSSSFLIDLSSAYEFTTTITPIIPLLRANFSLHQEITKYLASKQVTFYCSRNIRPSVLHRISRPIYSSAEVIVIEDSANRELTLSFFPNLRCICFCQVLQSTITLPSETSPLPAREDLLSIPTNDAILKVVHGWWKDLRIDNLWVRALWKDRKDIRVVLRRVLELEVVRRDVVYSHHAVVDVDTIRVIAKGYLPDRKKDEEVVYDYGNARWWRCGPVKTVEEGKVKG